jgi:A/G-specific adenine glycosylase
MTDEQGRLLKWYKSNGRSLPWRGRNDPYEIWVSEVMLQQTTSQAVVPFFDRFLKRFPNVKSLADAEIGDVYELWAGLGYYSRARNLHRAAQKLSALAEFPKTHTTLIEMPGFGPYTSRAVSSLAYDENVGLVDGNVIRVLSRRYALKANWWNTTGRAEIQKRADVLVRGVSARDMNQALMDLGAMVCTSRSPKCGLCPWVKLCAANREENPESYPAPKPKKNKVLLAWYPTVSIQKNSLLLSKNDYAPFLKGQWFLPGSVKSLKSPPKRFLFKHAITHHEIYAMRIQNSNQKKRPSSKPNSRLNSNLRWVKLNEISRICPVSLVTKTLKHVQLRADK